MITRENIKQWKTEHDYWNNNHPSVRELKLTELCLVVLFEIAKELIDQRDQRDQKDA